MARFWQSPWCGNGDTRYDFGHTVFGRMLFFCIFVKTPYNYETHILVTYALRSTPVGRLLVE